MDQNQHHDSPHGRGPVPDQTELIEPPVPPVDTSTKADDQGNPVPNDSTITIHMTSGQQPSDSLTGDQTDLQYIGKSDRATEHMATNSLNDATQGQFTQFRPSTPAARRQTGQYQFLSRIGEGGMGEVWSAIQSEPVKRRVAIKLIKPGFNSKTFLNRFDSERQALAVMDHPNIARILDVGTSENNQPFFVMEWIQGLHVTDYVRKNALHLGACLELFEQTCLAIQHAHQKGIIHRDIKPSNVLVTTIDDRPTVKVIDFGLAKAFDRRYENMTYQTEAGLVLGTPAYMSPEQADILNRDIDTRTDIYSLGALLFELLTGSTPLDITAGRTANFLETLRNVREKETPRPSVVLQQHAKKTKSQQPRRTDEVHVVQRLPEELDWIVLKCLEKDRQRRYESAGALVADVRRYLNGEAVEACPPTFTYRATIWLRSNRTLVTSAFSIFVSLLLGLLGTSWAWSEAVKQRRVAESAVTETVRANFLRITEERRHLLDGGITSAIESLVALAAACETWPTMTRAEFGRMTRPILARHPEIQALEWVPRVRSEERSRAELLAQKDGLVDFQIRERDPIEGIRRAGDRSDYFPVYYVEPIDGNESAAGFDLAASTMRRSAMERADQARRPAASAPIRLIQEKAEQSGFLVFQPVYATQNQLPGLRGYAVAVFRIDDLINGILGDLRDRDTTLEIRDITADPNNAPIYTSKTTVSTIPTFVMKQDIDVGGRHWQLSFTPMAN